MRELADILTVYKRLYYPRVTFNIVRYNDDDGSVAYHITWKHGPQVSYVATHLACRIPKALNASLISLERSPPGRHRIVSAMILNGIVELTSRSYVA